MSEITTIRFDGDNLQTVREGERVWVVLKRACEALGIDESGQRQKLAEKAWAVAELISATGNDAKTYEMFCVDLDTLPMWLATIDVGRVRPEAREKLIAYQRECARVLRDHFFGARTSSVDLTAIEAAVTHLAGHMHTLADKVHWLSAHVAQGGLIAPAKLRHIQDEVKSIAALEVAGGRFKTQRAATADLYREMGVCASWGGKGQPWTHLPEQLVPIAETVLRVRRKDAERLVCGGRPGPRGSQLSVVFPKPEAPN
jgi:hypothetical protein